MIEPMDYADYLETLRTRIKRRNAEIRALQIDRARTSRTLAMLTAPFPVGAILRPRSGGALVYVRGLGFAVTEWELHMGVMKKDGTPGRNSGGILYSWLGTDVASQYDQVGIIVDAVVYDFPARQEGGADANHG